MSPYSPFSAVSMYAVFSGSDSNKSFDLYLLYVPVPNTKVGRDMSESLVKEGYAICCNLTSPVESTYVSKDKFVISEECILWVRTENYKKAIKYIESIHPYETPAILVLSVLKINKQYKKSFKKSWLVYMKALIDKTFRKKSEN